MKNALGKKAFRALLLCLVLLLGGYLRSVGLTWGLNTGFGSARTFHPDELASMRGVLQLDPLARDFTAPAAYFEGTFNYYLWALPAAAIRHSSGVGNPLPAPSAEDYERIIFVCRVMTVALDVLAIFVLFLAAGEATRSFFPALLASFVYAIIPMQVIYAHYMRVHVLSNLLCALVFWLSLRLLRSPSWWLCFLAGMISGLGAATRFPLAAIVAIPCLFLLFKPSAASVSWFGQMLRSALALLSGPIWWIGLGFLAGLFIGEPIWFFDPGTVLHEISKETFRFVPSNAFAGTGLFDFSRHWEYLSFLVPYGMYPLLWVVVYGAILYLGFRRSLYNFTLPILLFSLLYFYPMAKGYATPVFARAVMLFFPGFCILIALATYDIVAKRKVPTVLKLAVAAILVTASVPSLLFDWAYVTAMTRPDVREVLYADLKTMLGTERAAIGVEKSGAFFYTVLPAVEPLRSNKVTVKVQELRERADFFILGRTGTIDAKQFTAAVKSVEKGGKFRFAKIYRASPGVFGREIDLLGFPLDMTYPFPTILLFRATNMESSFLERQDFALGSRLFGANRLRGHLKARNDEMRACPSSPNDELEAWIETLSQ